MSKSELTDIFYRQPQNVKIISPKNPQLGNLRFLFKIIKFYKVDIFHKKFNIFNLVL